MAFNRTLAHFTSSQELATIWATGQNYLLNQLVLENDVIYRCIIAHTSGASFSTDFGAGKWVAVSAAGASGSKNYIENNDFEDNNTTGWGLFNTTINSTTKIPTGSVVAGAAGFNALSASASSPLAGSYSLSVSTPAGVTITTTGFGFISDAFTIDREDQAKVMGFSFYYEAASGTMNFSGTSANTFAVYIRDVSGGEWIQPAGVYNLVQSSGVGLCSGTFQTTASGTQYQIAVLMINTVSASVSMRFDDFQLGPQQVVVGVPSNDWTTYTPTVTNGGGNLLIPPGLARWRRVGDSVEVIGSMFAGGAGAAGDVGISFPPGIVPDTTKMPLTGGAQPCLGPYAFVDFAPVSGGAYKAGNATFVNTTEFKFFFTGTNNFVRGTDFSSSDLFSWQIKYPVAGWSSNTVMSQDTDTRVVAAKAFKNASSGTQTIAALTGPSTIVLNETYFDTHAAYSTASNSYVFPVSGIYKVGAKVIVRASVASSGYIRLAGTGILTDDFSFIASSAGDHTFDVYSIISADAGDTVSLSVRNETAGASIQILSTATWSGGTSLSIERLSGPATIAASETVAMARAGSVVRSVPVAGAYLDFDNASGFTDTHGAWRAGSGYVAGTGAWSVQPAYVVPVSGIYSVSVRILLGSTAGFKQLFIHRNGSTFASTADDNTFAGNFPLSMHGQIRCNAGDLLQVFFAPQNAQNAPSTVSNFWTGIEISRVGN